MLTIAFGNQKGGVGKTTTVRNLADMLAVEHGKRVLMIDADPQHSLTNMCDVDTEANGLYEFLEDSEPSCVHEIAAGQWLMPSTNNLADMERNLKANSVLHARLDEIDRTEAYDFVLIDCPPSLGRLTANALFAADYVLSITKPQADDADGVHEFMHTVEQVQGQNDGYPRQIGVLLNEWDGRLRLHRATAAALADELVVLNAKIGRTVRIAEASDQQTTLLGYDRGNKQVANYRALAEEILNAMEATN